MALHLPESVKLRERLQQHLLKPILVAFGMNINATGLDAIAFNLWHLRLMLVSITLPIVLFLVA